jgi:hypothetical protein
MQLVSTESASAGPMPMGALVVLVQEPGFNLLRRAWPVRKTRRSASVWSDTRSAHASLLAKERRTLLPDNRVRLERTYALEMDESARAGHRGPPRESGAAADGG